MRQISGKNQKSNKKFLALFKHHSTYNVTTKTDVFVGVLPGMTTFEHMFVGKICLSGIDTTTAYSLARHRNVSSAISHTQFYVLAIPKTRVIKQQRLQLKIKIDKFLFLKNSCTSTTLIIYKFKSLFFHSVLFPLFLFLSFFSDKKMNCNIKILPPDFIVEIDLFPFPSNTKL